MRVLFLTPRFPYPPLKGDQVVAYHRLRLLSRRHEITLLSFVESEEELAGAAELERYCEAIHTFQLPPWRSFVNVAARAPFSRLPLQVLYYASDAARKRVETLLASDGFDVVHAYFHRMASYVSDAPVPKVLDLMDSMQLRMQRNAAVARPPKRWMFREELRRVTPYEVELARRFDEVIVVSEQDRDFLPDGRVTVVPNGVDTDLFAPTGEAKGPTIVFSGHMSYDPNVHAVTWFAERCFPRVRAQVPEASLVIAGWNPAKAVRELGTLPGVEVTGWVESMPAILNRAAVAIAPMQSGSGIQNKILEAMSCELPVVTTTIGLGSIGAKPEDEIVVADGEEPFADAVVRLLRSPERAADVGRRARRYVLDHHSWQSAADQVDEVYQRAAHSAR